MAKKLILSLVSACFDPKLVPKTFSRKKQFQGKLMNQTWKNGKKPSFGSDFGPFGPKYRLSIIFPKNLAGGLGQLSSCT